MSIRARLAKWIQPKAESLSEDPEKSALRWLLMMGDQSIDTSTNQNVTPSSSLTVTAYYACIKNISEDLAKIPLKTYSESPNGSKVQLKETVYSLLNRSPDGVKSAFTFRMTIIAHKCGWGNGYAEIEKNVLGEPIALHLIHPSRVEPKIKGTKVVYQVRNNDGVAVEIPSDRMFHIKGFSDDGVTGMSVLKSSRIALGVSIAAQKFAASFFGNSVRPSGIIEYPGRMTGPAIEQLRKSWEEVYGGVSKTGKTIVLEEGGKWTQTTIPPDEAQFLETRQFQVEEICRLFRMPPHKIQHLQRSTFSNIEHQGIEYVQDCLMGHAVEFEDEVSRKLLPMEQYTKLSLNSLLRGDFAGRSNFYKALFQMASLSPNDIRKLEDMDPIDVPAADLYYLQMQMVPLGTAPKEPSKPPAVGKSEEDEEVEMVEMNDFIKNQNKVVLHIVGRLVRKELLAHSKASAKYSSSLFTQWQSQFYNEHTKQFVDTLTPIFHSMFSTMHVGFDGDLSKVIEENCTTLPYEAPHKYDSLFSSRSEEITSALFESLLRRTKHEV